MAPVLAACAGKSGDDGDSEPRVADVVVVVENRNWQDVTVYALRGGARVRLGTVTTYHTETFVMKSEMTRSVEFRLLADPIGSLETYQSDPVRIEPGDQIRWTLTADLDHSFIFVF